MKIAVLGLGYAGAVSAACLASRGHQIVGVDVEPRKVGAINEGRAPVVEPGLDGLIERAVGDGSLTATSDTRGAVVESDVSLVCVGTPGQANGALDLKYLSRAAEEIGAALAQRQQGHVVTFRSTMLPGTVEDRLIPVLESSSGLRAGEDFGVAVNPEFLREGSGLEDFEAPSRIVVGQLDQRSGDTVMAIYDGIDAPRVQTTLRTAEIVKYADNCFHALKVGFANEFGNICKAAGVDAREMMEIFCLDTKLNIAPAYLRPGAAFGGSCLPKDLRAMVHQARTEQLNVPLLDSVLRANEEQKKVVFELVCATGKRKIGILGLSFKPDTDDLRESPAVELAESLIGKGREVEIYDRNVALARLVGANLHYIEREIPHISRLLRRTAEEVVRHAEVLVVTAEDPEFADMVRDCGTDTHVIDLVGITTPDTEPPSYEGICW